MYADDKYKPKFEDGTSKFEEGQDDETPEQKKIADDDELEETAKFLGWTVEEVRRRSGLT
jgi:hypothetical protein